LRNKIKFADQILNSYNNIKDEAHQMDCLVTLFSFTKLDSESRICIKSDIIQTTKHFWIPFHLSLKLLGAALIDTVQGSETVLI
jgi:hypothetical protein